MKSRSLLYTAAAAVSLLSLWSCSQEEIELYNGPKAGIFIQQIKSYDGTTGMPISYKDSTTISFASYSAEYTSYPERFYVQTLGEVTDYDRRYSLTVDLDESTAVEGTDFSLDRNDYIIHAGQSRDTVIVTLLRTPTLRSKTLKVKLNLRANENFDIIFDSYKNSGAWNIDGDTLCATSYKILFNETYNEPSYWSFFGNDYFGKFTAAKMLELEKVMGWSYTDWRYAGMSGAKVAYGKMDFAANALQKHLQSLADAGTPAREDDGSLMQLPSPYAVDYTAYE